jgi:hypothetical protein
MSEVELIGTERIGQLTGSTDSTTSPDRPRPWPLPVDSQGWPLLQDTGAWGVVGVDLGANTEHSDGRLYFFFGDVATSVDSGNQLNTDLVAWTDDTYVHRHGGHLALGWTFVLPFQPTGVQGQPDWCFCGKCNGLFWNGDSHGFRGVCSKGGAHSAIGNNFVLPFQPTSVQGQSEWRFCGKCAGLFWNGDPNGFKGVCPQGGVHSEADWTFVLPFQPTEVQGQPNWRFCANCAGLFFDGYAQKGLCPGAPGGGFYLHPVLNDRGKFDPFVAQEPIGHTLSNETPNGAFSYNGRIYLFAGIAPQYWRELWEQPRPGDPAAGCYLVSKDRPDLPSNPEAKPVPPIPPNAYHREFLFSPRIGWCPRDQSRDRLESHEILGFKFALPHDLPQDPTLQQNWRLCYKCGAMFWDGDLNNNRCHKGGAHESAPSGANYCLPHSINEDFGNQGSWCVCGKCSALFWNGDSNNKGLCAAGGDHEAPAAAFNLVLPHDFPLETNNQGDWRFCGKCAGMFWDGDHHFKGCCPKDGQRHEGIGLTFVLQHEVNEDNQNQKNWRFCGKCAGLFFDGHPDKGSCPKGGGHEASPGSYNFVLRHDVNEDRRSQQFWRFCGKCAGLFFDGYPDKGSCPKGGGHEASPGSYNFVLGHNPGAENEGDWRFCTKCHGMVKTGQEDIFTWVAPVVVQNADHSELPSSPYPQAVVMFGFGYSGTPGIRLAWMPLKPPAEPTLQDVLYYTGRGSTPWSSEAADAVVLFPHSNDYSHVSAAWLEGPKRWIVLYGTAIDNAGDAGFRRPAMARIGTTLFPVENWTAEIEIFNPLHLGAYGKYMHDPGKDTINPDVPPREPPPLDHPGWAYGVFILNRFTNWDASTRELGIYYLLSTSSPYQVHLMHTRLRLRLPAPPQGTIQALLAARIDFSVSESDLRRWLGDGTTPYPGLANALLEMLGGKRLKQPVYIDVIAWNYEHMTGQATQANHATFDLSRLKAAVVEGYNTRHGTSVTGFEGLIE